MSRRADCTYPEGTTVTEVYSNHYGASSIRTILQNLETSYFTNAEQALMNETTILTNDTKLQDDGKSLQESICSTTDKLYLAHGNDHKRYVTVGSSDSLDGGLLVDKFFFYRTHYGTGYEYVWLRTPAKYRNGVKIIVDVLPVNSAYIYSTNQLVPAFELNLSSVIFASAAPAATSTGNLKLQNTQNLVANGAFTLRHKADNIGSATVSYDRSRVTLTDVPNGTYLVVQNSTEAKARKITDETEVSASTMEIENF